MSSLNGLEPQPTAKVLLHTTAGSLTLELFAKQTPLASRNFLQHCLDGYYNNTIFHRLVPGFIIQGGDPTGTGSGGISAIEDGQGFQDEIHTRLKFNRRGILGMANEGKDSNGSQFFLTLGETPELQGKHTMFGRIEGDTIYNLMKMGEAELTEEEGSDRPLYPTKVTGSEILVNPFEGMVARAREAPRTVNTGMKDVKKRKKPAGKNVLSFGDEEEEEGMVAPVIKKAKANPKLVSVEQPADDEDTSQPKAAKKKAKKQRYLTPEVVPEVKSVPKSAPAPEPESEEDEDDEVPESKRDKQLENTNAEIAALKASMKRTVNAAPEQKERPKNALEAMIPSTSTRGRKRGKGADEKGALDLFKAFKSRLEDMPAAEAEPEKADEVKQSNDSAPVAADEGAGDEEAALCDLHFIANCQSCKTWDDDAAADAEADDDDGGAWMAHRLTFAKDTLGKDLEWKRKMEEIEVIDPREKARTIKEEGKRDKGKGKARA